MQPLRKFLRLTARERRLLVSAAFCLGVMRLGLWVLPFRTLLRHLPQVTAGRDRLCGSDHLPAEQLAWAVGVASRYLPGSGNCLVRALATRVMLARRGYLAHLRIGVAKDAGGRFQAHAWVECEGTIVIGGMGRVQYTPLPLLERQRS